MSQYRRTRVPATALCIVLLVLILPGFLASRQRAVGADIPVSTAPLPGVSTSADLRSVASSPTPSMGFRLVGQIGGPTQAVAVQGRYAYVGVGPRLVVLDVSDPTNMHEVGATTPFPRFVEDVTISGTLAYVAAGGAGLRVVSVTDPRHPIELGFWDSLGFAEGAAVSGNLVYLADGPYGLRVLDASDPARPTEIGSAFDMNYAYEVAVSGRYAYIAAAGAGLLVADVSDPAHPVEMGSLDTRGYAYGVAVSGTVVYVADGWEGVRLVDVSSPAAPATVSVHETPGWAFAVAISGTLAYVGDGGSGLQVVDVATPTQPAAIGSFAMAGGHARSVAVAGAVAYVADSYWGVRAVQVENPSAPVQVGLYSPLGAAVSVAAAGNYAYVAAAQYGLRIVDVSDPAHPVQAGAFDPQDIATSVVVSGSLAYLNTFTYGGLHILDISQPARPTRIGFIDRAGRDLAVHNGIAYLPDEFYLRLVDVSDPYRPTLVGSIELLASTGMSPIGVAVSGTLAYVACGTGIQIVDVSDPANPTRIGQMAGPDVGAVHLVILGNLAYVASAYYGLSIWDVSDPRGPTRIGSSPTMGAALDVAISGTIAYVASHAWGVSSVDISDPRHPVLTGSYDTIGVSYRLAVVGERIYVADGLNGLVILDLSGATQSPPASAFPLVPVLPDSTTLWGAGVRARRPPDSPPAPSPAARAPQERASSVCTVTRAGDSGPGTLRFCMEHAVQGDTILFDPLVFPPQSPVTITLASGLPELHQGHLTIDASNAGVILDGSKTTGWTDGLWISSAWNVIRGLQILYFPHTGIELSGGATYNQIGGNRNRGSGPLGEGNLVSGNGLTGISIGGAGTMSNTMSGNFIGTDVSGTRAIPNGGTGGGIYVWSSFNRIGGTTPGEGNLVSGNVETGINLQGLDATNNVIVGNYVGTDVTGSVALGNRGIGIGIVGGAPQNLVTGNLVSGNGSSGIQIADLWSNYNTITRNLIGTDHSGTAIISNGRFGIQVAGGPSYNLIGGDQNNEGNVVSGSEYGIVVGGEGSVGNLILGNLIGTNISGTQPLGNGWVGVFLETGGRSLLGGPMRGERNIISGNATGVALTEDYGYVAGNQIGTDISGMNALPNGGDGIVLSPRIEPPVIQGNQIAFNGAAGVSVGQPGSSTIRRNSIYGNAGKGIEGGDNLLPAPVIAAVSATLVSGAACPACTIEVFSDDEDEGRIYEGTTVAEATGVFTFTKAGGLTGLRITATATDGAGNTSQFSAPVVLFYGGRVVTSALDSGPGTLRQALLESWDHTVITFDRSAFPPTRPTTITLDSPLPALSQGAVIIDASNAGVILDGSRLPAESNADGLLIVSNDNVVKGLQIVNFPQAGIYLDRGAQRNTIGGNRARGIGPTGEGNVLSGNRWAGIEMNGAETRENVLQGNYIGTDAGGAVAFGNNLGVRIVKGANHNLIGGMSPGEGNVIAGNAWVGLEITCGEVSYQGGHHNVVVGNRIGTDVSGMGALGNGGSGVTMAEGSHHNTIGPANTIAYNHAAGVGVDGNASLYNTITRNAIHDNGGLGILLSNGGNNMLPAPLASAVVVARVSGTACPGCTVEVFSDAEDGGRIYEGSAAADAAGWFTLVKPGGFTGSCITATATDSEGNTSEFSLPARFARVQIWLPVVLRP